jgi:hypothetical protein
VTIKKTASIRVGKRGKKTETHKAKSKEKKKNTLRNFEKKNHIPKLASASGKDHVSLLEVSKMTAEFTLPNRSVRRTRQRPAKEIITSRCPTILAATPASIGGISPSRTRLPSCLYVSPVASSSSSPVQIRRPPAPSQY